MLISPKLQEQPGNQKSQENTSSRGNTEQEDTELQWANQL